MVRFPSSAQGRGSEAIVHFFVGLMKADGGVSSAELDKVKILLYKFKTQLPGEYEHNANYVLRVNEDEDYASWTPDQHMEHGFVEWQKFVDSGEASERNVEAVFTILEIVSEVGDVSPGERIYLDRMSQEFSARFNYAI